MKDRHCHILPELDDGSRSMQESLAMLQAARKAGITSIVCTPHCRDHLPFDYSDSLCAFEALSAQADGMHLELGFEVSHKRLMELGLEWASRLACQETGDFLLELSTRASVADYRMYERTIYELRSRGLRVIVAHPERYRAIQENLDLAYDLVNAGCELQASANFISKGLFDASSRTAKKLFKEGLYSYLASDAHRLEDYQAFEKAWSRYGKDLTTSR